jgi:hypothetical protein
MIGRRGRLVVRRTPLLPQRSGPVRSHVLGNALAACTGPTWPRRDAPGPVSWCVGANDMPAQGPACPCGSSTATPDGALTGCAPTSWHSGCVYLGRGGVTSLRVVAGVQLGASSEEDLCSPGPGSRYDDALLWCERCSHVENIGRTTSPVQACLLDGLALRNASWSRFPL